MSFEIDYDQMLILDAEQLAERGLSHAYERLLPQLQRFVAHPVTVTEQISEDGTLYSVLAANRAFAIVAPDLAADEGQRWGRATYALFAIVNEQLESSTHRFYALNGGNDLGGIFLSPDEAESARASLDTKTDWPYM